MRWLEVQLSPRVADVIRGVTFSHGDAIREPREGYVPVLRAGNIGAGLVTDQDLIWIPKSFVSAHQVLRACDIVMCTSSGSPAVVGKSAMLDKEFEGTWGAFNAVIRVGGQAIPQFVFYFLQSSQFRDWRDRHATGANIQNIRFSELARLRIPLPPTSEQRQIVELLDKADHLRKLRRDADAKAARIWPALFLRMFGDPGANPKGWPVRAIEGVARVVGGATPRTENRDYFGGSVLWATPKDLSTLDDYMIEATAKTLSAEGLSSCSATVLPARSVLFSSRAPIGLVAINLNPMCTNQGFKSLVPSEAVNEWYLFGWLLLRRSYIESLGRGATFKEVSKDIVENLVIPIPDRSLQDVFARRMEAVRALRVRARQCTEKINALWGHLLQRAFSGELTAKWRDAHMKELLAEMQQQAKQLNNLASSGEPLAAEAQA